jgi:hypothetical protein
MMAGLSGVRMWLGVAGVLVAAAAVGTGSHLAGWVAVLLLGAALAVRLSRRRKAAPPGPPEETDGEAETKSGGSAY